MPGEIYRHVQAFMAKFNLYICIEALRLLRFSHLSGHNTGFLLSQSNQENLDAVYKIDLDFLNCFDGNKATTFNSLQQNNKRMI